MPEPDDHLVFLQDQKTWLLADSYKCQCKPERAQAIQDTTYLFGSISRN